MRRRKAAALLATLPMGVTIAGVAPNLANAAGQISMSYIVFPHSDDEFQAWSLIENSPSNYKVFVVATRGEETAFCTPSTYAGSFQPQYGEVASAPAPTGKWTTSCATARQNSLLAYLTQMSAVDSTIPGSFGAKKTYGPFPANGATICRVDNGVSSCGTAERSVDVWVDTKSRGAVVSFNLGDGDLTQAEVTWALTWGIHGGVNRWPDLGV